MVGIDKTKDVLRTIGDMVIMCVSLSKGGIRLSNLSKITAIVSEMKVLARDFSPVLIELKDLDVAESAELAAISFEIMQGIIAEFVK